MANIEVIVKSPIASAMGARISVTGPGRSMYLIIGTGVFPHSDVMRAGGEVILSLNGRGMLATLPFAGYLALRSNCQISHIGPVTVDVKRLARLAEMLAKTSNPGTGGAG